MAILSFFFLTMEYNVESQKEKEIHSSFITIAHK